MNSQPPITVGAVLFPRFELLDLYGPLEMFGLLEHRATIRTLAEEKGPVASSCDVQGFAEAAMADAGGFDVLLLPGGIGTRQEMNNPPFLAELTRLATQSKIVATVCTGSFLLAKTGLLDGRRATTNKRVFKLVASTMPSVAWVAKARWVEDGPFLTSSGVSAGMDMTLAIIAKLRGRDLALETAARAEYDWHQDSAWDPFAADIA